MNVTYDLLAEIAPNGKTVIMQPVAVWLEQYRRDFFVDTDLRLAHFLAQAAHETAGFRTLVEYASGAAYEGRPDLGNVLMGDGKRYKGRGIFQLTGRANYRDYGKELNVDLEGSPDMAADPEISVRVALLYWKRKGLNGWADKDDIKAITKRINGGYNGLDDRKLYLKRAKVALGLAT